MRRLRQLNGRCDSDAGQGAQNRAEPLTASTISREAKPIMAQRPLLSSALGVKGPNDSSFLTPCREAAARGRRDKCGGQPTIYHTSRGGGVDVAANQKYHTSHHCAAPSSPRGPHLEDGDERGHSEEGKGGGDWDAVAGQLGRDGLLGGQLGADGGQEAQLGQAAVHNLGGGAREAHHLYSRRSRRSNEQETQWSVGGLAAKRRVGNAGAHHRLHHRRTSQLAQLHSPTRLCGT